MFTERKAANALGGKTSRACDGCLRKRARWFCVADDAFLCQACDVSVHSANQLASRHQRVRLETASQYKTNGLINTGQDHSAPAWHQGFTRKARTPRHNNKSLLVQQQLKDAQTRILNPLPLVPEIGNEEEGNNLVSDETEDDQLLYRVPVFDPFAAELCDKLTSEEGNMVVDDVHGQEGTYNVANLPGFLPADIDLAEFAADVENLLEREVDVCSLDGKDIGVLDCGKGEDDGNFCSGDGKVKVKDEQEVEAIEGWHFDQAFDMSIRDQPLLDWSFDYESPADVDEVEEKVVSVPDIRMINNEEHKMEMKRNIILKLNYDSVISAWASQGCPWTTGTRPELNPDCWSDCMGTCPKDLNHQAYRMLGGQCHTGSGGGPDGGREARVLRYKEKRRTRLFSKKIRYEVRKLNAEKRPRMKGRFVKRTSFMGTAFPYLNK